MVRWLARAAQPSAVLNAASADELAEYLEEATSR
jgi:hypothetical protein